MASYILSTHSFKWVKSNAVQPIFANVDSICTFDSFYDQQLLAFVDDLPDPRYLFIGNDTVTIIKTGYYIVALNFNIATFAPNTWAIVQAGIEPYVLGMQVPVCSEAQSFIPFASVLAPFNISLSPTAIVKLSAGQRLRCHIMCNNDSFILPSSGIAISLLNIGST